MNTSLVAKSAQPNPYLTKGGDVNLIKQTPAKDKKFNQALSAQKQLDNAKETDKRPLNSSSQQADKEDIRLKNKYKNNDDNTQDKNIAGKAEQKQVVVKDISKDKEEQALIGSHPSFISVNSNQNNRLPGQIKNQSDELNRGLISNLKASVIFNPQNIAVKYASLDSQKTLELMAQNQAQAMQNAGPNTSDKISTPVVINGNQLRSNFEAGVVFAYPVYNSSAQNFKTSALESENLANTNNSKSKNEIFDTKVSADSTNLINNSKSNNEVFDFKVPVEAIEKAQVSEDKESLFFNEQQKALQNSGTEPKDKLGNDSKLLLAKNLDYLMPQVKNTINNGASHMKIKLNPEKLGALEFSFSRHNGKISAELVSDNKEISEHLKTQIESLKQSLSDQGIKLDNFDVKYKNEAGPNNQMDNGSEFASGNNNQEQSDANVAANDKNFIQDKNMDMENEPAANKNLVNSETKNKVDLKI